MADLHVNAPREKPQKGETLEYNVYFWAVFAIALIPGFLTWSWRLVTEWQSPRSGPFKRAMKDANVIAPLIFRG